MKKQIALIVVLAIVCMVLAGCCINREKVLVSSDCVTISQQGRKIRIVDAVSGMAYQLITRRVRPAERPEMPFTAIDTATLKVEILQGGFSVTSLSDHARTVYQFTRRRGVH